MERRKPLVGITADHTQIGPHASHTVGDKYVAAIVDGAQALAMVLPALGERQSVDDILDAVDGLLFTGSYSNVEPHLYGGEPSAPGTKHDSARDATTLPLLRAAIAAGVPVLAVCRGFQELNVVCGGTLHQRVHEVPGFADHREDDDAPMDTQYGPAHVVRLTPGGKLHALAGGRDEVRVNSLHKQGIAQLGSGLAVEAVAPDGLVEAVSVVDAPAFALAVQWHPEWRHAQDPLSSAIFRAFGDACRARRAARTCATAAAALA
ncbi:gamma-glutamyl-gamma-aminobutyrate hydrolase family protein [Burkholderia cepacia]|uniref:gamma-glutamyl-gamma-aminobutyrate hydrolase n=1 Tax=Burkholderia cepacia TaxID=292 RepID=A0AAX2RBR7_BURCE|nr:gamma-glutamyl-gamma-aminobutyrate hydrolase family protein [Burkholderia cepacia]TES61645.1 gamma-glutamyl-gamma-aminobutyrate hydrolase family protein [Burkholderia cepacia]TES95292.1 gamma-glutamyl-gamma-aminobutyrate hydrolase family protein [Burkholderia cepacia]TEU30897.1 gamma-glutamyl-gamma-aminobutyrate hydrolase family protein [Burkholderia cepacia]TEU31343.1 gamma-glutamyl-gamma-aminobutyrate hydrolase family protein [Burkholderia cepacia]TEU33138.1 gamma-glutamyl-gamma-aminobuty